VIERGGGVDETPWATPLPDPADIVAMNALDMITTLQAYSIEDDWAALVQQAQAYVTRVRDIPPGSPRWEQEIERLTTTESDRGLIGTARRMTERYTTAEAIDGNPGQQLIRIAEGDENTCDECWDREGAIGTIAEHSALGLPGAASCLGGHLCRCTLVPID
jgi:hypothetical protein